MSGLRAKYLVPLAQWGIPPAEVGRLTLTDFEQLTGAIDAEIRAQSRDGK